MFTYHLFPCDKRGLSEDFDQRVVVCLLTTTLGDKLSLQEHKVLYELICHFFCHYCRVEDAEQLVCHF